MNFPFFKKLFLIVSLSCCLFSCSSDLDFEQADDFNIQPVFTTNLAYLKGEASDFVSDGVETPVFSYTSNVDFLDNSFVEDDLIKAELYFRIKNTIPRAYVFNVTFLDENNSPIHSIRMDVPAYSGTEVVFEKKETFASANIDIIKNTTKMVFSVLMQTGPPLTATSPGRIELSSSITAYFDIE